MILKEIKDFHEDSNKQFAELKQEVTKTNSRLDDAEKWITTNAYRGVEEVITELVQQQAQLRQKLSELEGRSCRKNIRIYGVPESAGGRLHQWFCHSWRSYYMRIWEYPPLRIYRSTEHTELWAHPHLHTGNPDRSWSDFKLIELKKTC